MCARIRAADGWTTTPHRPVIRTLRHLNGSAIATINEFNLLPTNLFLESFQINTVNFLVFFVISIPGTHTTGCYIFCFW